MSIEASDQNVAAILEQLRSAVQAGRAGLADGSAQLSGAERELRHAGEEIEITRVVSAHWPLEGRSLYERGCALLNKLVRRYLRWYINPIVEQQNAYNDASARAIRLLIEQNAELRRELSAVRAAAAEPPPDMPA